MYTLADAINPETGWGLAGETWRVMESLERLGGITWFNLGDQDLATHCYRTQRLAEGAALERGHRRAGPIAGGGGPPAAGDRRSRSAPGCSWSTGPRSAFRSTSSASATTWRWPRSASRGPPRRGPAPGVLEAIAGADTVVVCPSNPVVSIDPLLAVPGRARPAAGSARPTSSGSPRSSPGPPSRGRPTGCCGRWASSRRWSGWPGGTPRGWAPWSSTRPTPDLAAAVEAEGVRCVVAPTVMSTVARSAAAVPDGPRCRPLSRARPARAVRRASASFPVTGLGEVGAGRRPGRAAGRRPHRPIERPACRARRADGR